MNLFSLGWICFLVVLNSQIKLSYESNETVQIY